MRKIRFHEIHYIDESVWTVWQLSHDYRRQHTVIRNNPYFCYMEWARFDVFQAITDWTEELMDGWTIMAFYYTWGKCFKTQNIDPSLFFRWKMSFKFKLIFSGSCCLKTEILVEKIASPKRQEILSSYRLYFGTQYYKKSVNSTQISIENMCTFVMKFNVRMFPRYFSDVRMFSYRGVCFQDIVYC